jgi:hypothetical protein
VLEFIRKYIGSATPLIAGNSVYMDLLFLKVSKRTDSVMFLLSLKWPYMIWFEAYCNSLAHVSWDFTPHIAAYVNCYGDIWIETYSASHFDVVLSAKNEEMKIMQDKTRKIKKNKHMLNIWVVLTANTVLIFHCLHIYTS